MSKIRIVNWLLTRKCNLNCSYCAIVKNYEGKPSNYPDMSHYIKNEMPSEMVISKLKELKKHNPNIFNIFYGGEPLLKKDLPNIINFCNENEIQYTIISNNTPEVQPLIKKLFNETNYIQGFTSSVDPIFNEIGVNEDRVIKSIEGLKRLKEIQMKGNVKDVVAEVTVMNHNKHLLHKLLSELSSSEIYSSITFIDISKNSCYDFSNIRDENQLVKPNLELAKILLNIVQDKSLYVHMKDILIPKIFDTLPSNYDCELEKGIHNLTIDADGSPRLCLRIKGTYTPTIKNIFDKDVPTSLSKDFYNAICFDKEMFCELCNHSCLMMSQYIDNNNSGEDDLLHMDKRGK